MTRRCDLPTRYTLRRITASIMKDLICFNLINTACYKGAEDFRSNYLKLDSQGDFKQRKSTFCLFSFSNRERKKEEQLRKRANLNAGHRLNEDERQNQWEYQKSFQSQKTIKIGA